MRRQLLSAVFLVLLMTVLTGILYPLLVTGIASWISPGRATGSLVSRGGMAVGSELIGQPFSSPAYFWGRPSATPGFPYNGMRSGGSNLGPTNPALAAQVDERIRRLRAADPANTGPVPVDLVTASASGLDPDISPAAAFYQVPRVARARGLEESTLRKLVAEHIEGRTLGILGEPRVNVLRLNLDLGPPSEEPSVTPEGVVP
jgi:K+-transporting ATPase ATPase C chain